MTINEVTSQIGSLGNAWDQFRKINDARVSEIERKGNADPLFMDQLEKIGNVLDSQKRRLDNIETAYSRPAREVKNVRHADGNSEHKNAFNSYLRKGAVSELEAFEKKALSVGSDPDGGYLVTPTMSEQISKYVTESSPMRAIASVELISSDSLDVIIDNDSAEAGWTGETDATADTDTPQINKKSINTFELYAQPKATQKLIDDAAIDIEAWIAQKVADIFSTKENTAFISGDGTTQPKGILSYAAGTSYGQIEQIVSGSAGAITTDSVIKLFYGLKDEYARNANFLINRTSLLSVRLLKDTTGQYIWQPGLALGAPDTLLGVPVKQASDMPIPAANSLSLAVGDFSRGYKIVDRVGIRVLRDPFTEKPFVKFYTTKRVGGEVVNFEAIKLLKLAAS